MKFDDAFYNAFKDELQKEALIPQALALASRIPAVARIGAGLLRGGKALATGARAAGGAAGRIGSAARTKGAGLYSKLKGAAGSAASYAPSFMGGSNASQKKSSTYV